MLNGSKSAVHRAWHVQPFLMTLRILLISTLFLSHSSRSLCFIWFRNTVWSAVKEHVRCDVHLVGLLLHPTDTASKGGVSQLRLRLASRSSSCGGSTNCSGGLHHDRVATHGGGLEHRPIFDL